MAGIFRMTQDHTQTELLNLGLRYDLLLGVTERYNRMLSVSPSVSRTHRGRRQSGLCSPTRSPNWSAANFSVKGGIFFATRTIRRNVKAETTDWAAAIGTGVSDFPRTVLRTASGSLLGVVAARL